LALCIYRFGNQLVSFSQQQKYLTKDVQELYKENHKDINRN